MAIFSFDLQGLADLGKEISNTITNLQSDINKQHQNIAKARAAVSTAEKALAAAESAPMPTEPTAPHGPYGSEEAAKEAAASYASAMSSYSAAMSARESAISSARSALSTAQQALAEEEAVLSNLQEDLESLKNIKLTIDKTASDLEANNEAVVAYLTSELLNIRSMKTMAAADSLRKGIDNVVNKSGTDQNEVLTGYDFVIGADGNKYYKDLYDEFTTAQWVALAKNGSMGANAIATLMALNGYSHANIAPVLHAAGYNMKDSSWEDAVTNAEDNVAVDGNANIDVADVKAEYNIVDGVLYRGGFRSLEDAGIDLSGLHFMADGSDYGAGYREDAPSYKIVPDGSPEANDPYCITQSDYERILYIVAHEVGNTGEPTEMFATASALMNSLEQQWDGSNITENLNGFYKRNTTNDSNSIYYGTAGYTAKDNVREFVDMALNGQRAFGPEIQCWNSLGDNIHGKYGTPTDVGGIYTTNPNSFYNQ